jgi:hypothetical protein
VQSVFTDGGRAMVERRSHATAVNGMRATTDCAGPCASSASSSSKCVPVSTRHRCRR